MPKSSAPSVGVLPVVVCLNRVKATHLPYESMLALRYSQSAGSLAIVPGYCQ